MKPVAYVNLPVAEFREKVYDFGNDYEALGRWTVLFSRTLAMMGKNEPKDEFAMRLLDEVDGWRKDKAEKMRQLRESKKNGDRPPKPSKDEEVEVLNSRPDKKEKKKVFGPMQNVLYSEDEERKLREKLGMKFDRAVEILSNYKASSGKKYKSDYAATLNWVIARVEEDTRKGSGMSQAQRLALGIMGTIDG